jgi:hypothetical protein
MGMKLFCIVFKIWICWKLGHETSIETGLSVNGLAISRFALRVRGFLLLLYVFVCMEKIVLACFGKQLFSY